MSKKDNERDWLIYELFMLMWTKGDPEWLGNHVGRLADAYANPRDFFEALKQNKSHPAFTGVMQGKVNPKFIQRWEQFFDNAQYCAMFYDYEKAVANEERTRIERLQEAKRVVANEGRLAEAVE
jgi:hypothetical protein